MFSFRKKTKEEKEHKKKKKEQEKEEKLSKDELKRLHHLQSVYGHLATPQSSHNSGSPSSTPSTSQGNLAGPPGNNGSSPSPSSRSYMVSPPMPSTAHKPPPSRRPPALPPTSSLPSQHFTDTDDYSELNYHPVILGGGDEDTDRGGPRMDTSLLRLPELCSSQLAQCGDVQLARTMAGDFGFLLRRGVLLERVTSSEGALLESKKQVVLAEPDANARPTGLLPGDRLVGVNQVSVEEMPRDEVIGVIRESGDAVLLTVRPMPELAELSMRPVGGGGGGGRVDLRHFVSQQCSLRDSHKQADKSLVHQSNENGHSTGGDGSRRVWLLYREGFAGGCMKEGGEEGGKCLIRLDHDGREVQVDEEDIELANPESLDRCENLSNLRYVNESSVVHVIRQRFGSNLLHTYAGQSLLVVNPMTPLGIYSEKVMQLFRGCRQEDMPPHVFSVGQQALLSLQTSRQNQTICLLGRSGAGKTTTDRHIINYLLYATTPSSRGGESAGQLPRKVTADKVTAMMTLVEAFTCARTLLSSSASRCARLTSLEVSESAGETSVCGLQTQIFILEKTRLSRRPENESSFHVFYHMLGGMEQKLRNDLFLSQIDPSTNFITASVKPEEPHTAHKSWDRLTKAAGLLDISDQEWHLICRVLGSILLLAGAGATPLPSSSQLGGQFEHPTRAQQAAQLLGCSVDQVTRHTFDAGLEASGEQQNTTAASKVHFTPAELLEGFLAGLYAELVQIVVYLINRSLSSGQRSMPTISILDPPGFQQPGCDRSGSGGSLTPLAGTFEDLCYNYVNDRLLQLSHDVNFTATKAKYQQENIRADWFDEIDSSPEPIISLLDRNAQTQTTRSSSSPMRDGEGRGLLWMLDEEALSGGREDGFIRRLHTLYQQHKSAIKERGNRVLRRVGKSGSFVLNHCVGSHPVVYNSANWLKHCRECPTARNAHPLLQEGKLFGKTTKHTNLGMLQREVLKDLMTRANAAGQTIRRGGRLTSPTIFRQKSISSQIKLQMDFLVDQIRRNGRVHFVYCLLPNHNAGLADQSKDSPTPSLTAPVDSQLFSVSLLRQQIAGFQTLHLVRVHRQGFPDHHAFRDFRRRFGALLPPTERPESPILDERAAVQSLIQKLNLDASSYKLGVSQIFLRLGAANHLEDQWNDNVSENTVAFQARCRGYLARKKADKLRVQHKAMRCIQRNAARYLEMRAWSWWRLYTRVRPLLNLQRTEDELRTSAEHLQELTEKLERSEKERIYLKDENVKMEAKLSDLTSAVQEEQVSAVQTGDLLEDERDKRIQVERELEDVKIKLSVVQRHNGELEYDLMQAKNWQQQHSSQLHRAASDEDLAVEDSVYKERYHRAMQELDFLRKQNQTRESEIEDDQEKVKKQMDRRLAELLSDNDRLESEQSATKRRLVKIQSELSDCRVQVSESEARSGELERRQKRFDTEMGRLAVSQQEEAVQRERLQRERDEAVAERITLDRQLQEVRCDLELQSEKLVRVTSQLNEMSEAAGGSGSLEAELILVKRNKLDLEQKVKESEEELDEQAANIEMLQQTKLRLEMSLEKVRQQQAKELEDRDQEVESLRTSNHRRIRQLEQQLEEEREERQRLVKEKRDGDRQLAELVNREPQRDRDLERKLKKDLKKTKVLLKDAHAMLEQYKNQPDEKAALKHLRDQLEESELLKESSLRSKRSFEKDAEDLQIQLDEANKAKQEVEDRLTAVSRERTDLQSLLEDQEEELDTLLKKYKASAGQQSVDAAAISTQAKELSELAAEKDRLKLELVEAQNKMAVSEGSSMGRQDIVKFETRIRELETKYDLELTSKNRLQSQYDRAKEQLDQLQDEKFSLANSESAEKERNRRLQRQLRELKDEGEEASSRAQDAEKRRAEVTLRLEQFEEDHHAVQNDLKLALRRIQDLQGIIDDEMQDDSDGDDINSGSDSDSDLYRQKFAISNQLAARNSYRHSGYLSPSSSISGLHQAHHLGMTSSTNHYDVSKRSASISSSCSNASRNTPASGAQDPPTY